MEIPALPRVHVEVPVQPRYRSTRRRRPKYLIDKTQRRRRRPNSRRADGRRLGPIRCPADAFNYQAIIVTGPKPGLIDGAGNTKKEALSTIRLSIPGSVGGGVTMAVERVNVRSSVPYLYLTSSTMQRPAPTLTITLILT